ncbi:MAG: helix-turn-helix transcriptional regulator [Lawsonibacter sp.]|nr:helix-turn-helix transcriptional regulator [Lawsonibacter sp.]
MIKEKLGYRIRELRKQANMSQESFALSIDMDRTYLASVERGKRNISLENIYKIANGFHISIEELFKGM